MPAPPLTDAELHRLQWRSRRGLLENDLLITRFFARHGNTLTQNQARAFAALMQLEDGELLDILLARKEPQAPCEDTRTILRMLRPMDSQQKDPEP